MMLPRPYNGAEVVRALHLQWIVDGWDLIEVTYLSDAWPRFLYQKIHGDWRHTSRLQ